MSGLSLQEREVLSDCSKCIMTKCVHKGCFRRLPREIGGLELCPNITAAKQNRREFAVVVRCYFHNDDAMEKHIVRYADETLKDRVSSKFDYNAACYDQYIEYNLSYNEARKHVE
jgi:hypothetical protein